MNNKQNVVIKYLNQVFKYYDICMDGSNYDAMLAEAKSSLCPNFSDKEYSFTLFNDWLGAHVQIKNKDEYGLHLLEASFNDQWLKLQLCVTKKPFEEISQDTSEQILSQKDIQSYIQEEVKKQIQKTICQHKQKKKEKKEKKMNKGVFHGIICDGCEKHNLTGPIYHCMIREDFDFCSKCEKTKTHEYPMIKITSPEMLHKYKEDIYRVMIQKEKKEEIKEKAADITNEAAKIAQKIVHVINQGDKQQFEQQIQEIMPQVQERVPEILKELPKIQGEIPNMIQNFVQQMKQGEKIQENKLPNFFENINGHLGNICPGFKMEVFGQQPKEQPKQPKQQEQSIPEPSEQLKSNIELDLIINRVLDIFPQYNFNCIKSLILKNNWENIGEQEIILNLLSQ